MAEQKKKGLSRLNKAILFLITSAFFFALFEPGLSVFFFSIISRVPASIITMHMHFSGEMLSCRKMKASAIVSTVLDLSTGTTLFTSPT